MLLAFEEFILGTMNTAHTKYTVHAVNTVYVYIKIYTVYLNVKDVKQILNFLFDKFIAIFNIYD